MSNNLKWFRRISWIVIASIFVYVLIQSEFIPSRADLLNSNMSGDVSQGILWTNYYALVLCCVLFTVACIILAIELNMRKSLTDNLKRALLCFSQFLYCAFLWVLTDSYLLSLITSNRPVCALLSYVTFTIMFAFLFEFIMCLSKSMKVVEWMCYLLYGIAVIMLVNYFMPFIEKKALIYPVHIILLFSGVIILLETRKLDEERFNSIGKYLISGFKGLIVFFGVALLVYYFNIDLEYTVLMTLGILYFCYFLLKATAHVISTAYKEQAKQNIYKELAYKDEMTGLKNKTAYIEFERQPLKDNSIFVVLDLNNLKAINDTYGHRMGDKVIILASKTIVEFFGDENCYRFGGDEFAVTLNDLSLEEVKSKIDAMQKYLDEHNENSEIKIDFAIGYAKQQDGDTVETLFLRADQAMYKDKFESGDSRESNTSSEHKVFETNTNGPLLGWDTSEISES